tara:strand:+ start:4533 stop:5651 length:1119 start_codon:yes stop_codon:yes gene_type:complete
MKKKILVFHKGLAIYRVDFFNAVHEKYDATFYFDNKKQGQDTFNQFSRNYIESKCNFKSNYLLKGLKLFGRDFKWGITSIILREKPDFVICNEYTPVTIVVFINFLLSHKKFKFYTISDDSLENSMKRKGIRSTVRKILSKKIDGIIFPSNEVGNWYKNNVSARPKVLTLPIIHKDEVFRKELSNSLVLANKYIKSYDLNGKKIILFVGRLIQLKNIEFLLNSVAQINQKNFQLVIVGNGESMNSLKKKTLELQISDRVIFTDKKVGMELLAWYVLAQIFVLPSTFEQFGAVVNEALLAGCNVLCSEVAGASTLIRGNNGTLFNPLDQEQLTQLLNKTLEKEAHIDNNITTIRENKMPFKFNEIINNLFEKL